MIQKIKKDIEKQLDNTYSDNRFYIRCEIDKILRSYTETNKIYQYSIFNSMRQHK
jgi:hypothetical protein